MEPNSYGMNQKSIGSLAIISLVSSIMSFIFCPLIGGIIGIITGSIELKNIKKGITSENSRVIAMIGLWLGILNVILILVVFILIILSIIFFPNILDWIKSLDIDNDGINVIYRQLIYSFTVIANI